MKDSTKILQSIPVDPLTGSIAVPIYQTSTFVQEAPNVNRGFDYTRTNNPTRKILEEIAAQLENGRYGLAFSSGLAAIDCVVKLLNAGDEIIAVDDIYGGAYRLFTTVYNRFGIKVRFADTTDPENVRRAINQDTRLVWLESPTNPLLKVSDIRKISKIVKENGLLVCVDNTFATPIIQKPLDLGADIVLHSATKYIGGHTDVLAGIVVTGSQDLGERLKYIQNATGAVLSPFDSWLLIRSIETLKLRVEKHSHNALRIAEFLEGKEGIKNLYYPGLKSHPDYAVALQQQKLPGAIISFSLDEDTEENAVKFVTSTKLFKLAESLGGAKSLICHPPTMTHKSVPRDRRLQSGINDSLIRLSVGLEDAEDLIDDLDQALLKVNKNTETLISITDKPGKIKYESE